MRNAEDGTYRLEGPVTKLPVTRWHEQIGDPALWFTTPTGLRCLGLDAKESRQAKCVKVSFRLRHNVNRDWRTLADCSGVIRRETVPSFAAESSEYFRISWVKSAWRSYSGYWTLAVLQLPSTPSCTVNGERPVDSGVGSACTVRRYGVNPALLTTNL